MTDNNVTADDCLAHDFADRILATTHKSFYSKDIWAAARAIKSNVPAPPATLADELRYRATLLYNGDPDGDSAAAISALADRVENVVKERDEARASLKRERASLKRESEARSQWMEFYRKAEDEVRDLTAEVERLTSGRPTRAIDQAECLDKFQVGTVGRTAQTLEAWQRDVYGWNSPNRTGDFASKDIIERFGPMTILYSPEVSE